MVKHLFIFHSALPIATTQTPKQHLDARFVEQFHHLVRNARLATIPCRNLEIENKAKNDGTIFKLKNRKSYSYIYSKAR